MSNAHSKMMNTQYEDIYTDDFMQDKLVLCLYTLNMNKVLEDDVTDCTCFVLYDESEEEYFLCGKRTYVNLEEDQEDDDYFSFKFFCKSRSSVINMLASVLDVNNNTVNVELYNYTDIYTKEDGTEYKYLDYDALMDNYDVRKELMRFDEIEFDEVSIRQMLKMIKHVRY
jgi:hypothetical protein